MDKTTVFESIDRLLQVEVRLPFLVRGTIPKLYQCARGMGQPITKQIAEAIMAAIERGKNRIMLVTGFYEPGIFPCGESDGLYGAAALGKGLSKIGASVSIGVEPECAEAMQKLAECIDLSCQVIGLDRGVAQRAVNAKLADCCDIAIFIEKCGPSAYGVYHFATATPRDRAYDADMNGFLEAMEQTGKLTIGIGDYGNEIGFGNIYREALDIVGRGCKCPYNEGIVTVSRTNYLLPCCVSNIGAYGVLSALALLTGNLDILHTESDEHKLVELGNKIGVVDGSYGYCHDSVDGVPLAALCGYISILQAIPHQYYEDILDRGF
ncbi:MAG: glutamate cyclase domain-containing protein [Oscillospiraceae bacterium]